MTSNTDPPQTKTKRTTQKAKMISNTDPHKQKQNTRHRTETNETKQKHNTETTVII